MELIVIGVVGWLVYLEWKAGRLTLPLQGHNHLVDALANFAARPEIVPRSIITDRDRARGAITQYELQDFVVSQLAEQRFPRTRLHDLRKAVCLELKRRGETRNVSELKIAFDGIAELQDHRTNEWVR